MINLTYNEWIKQTTVGQKSRTPLLQALDAAVRVYEFASAFNKQKALHQLCDAYDAWCLSKDDVTQSIRNKGGTLIRDFDVWLVAQATLLMPGREMGWDGNPNCYAYAMKYKQVAGPAPTPGAADGHPVKFQDTRWVGKNPPIEYHIALLDGIVRDATECHKIVEILSGPAHGAYPLPSNLPTGRAGAASYIAAMIAKSDGFHFMRRDSGSGLWSHKNGGAKSPVETSAVLIPTGGKRTTRQVPITDEVAVELLHCTPGKYVGFSGFRFVGYVLVPHDGIMVASI